MRMLVTGAAGFIGSTYVRTVLAERDDDVVVLDKLTYAGRRENLQDVEDRIEFVEGAIEERDLVLGQARERRPVARVGELVEHDHVVLGGRDDEVDEVRADEAGTAGDQERAHAPSVLGGAGPTGDGAVRRG